MIWIITGIILGIIIILLTLNPKNRQNSKRYEMSSKAFHIYLIILFVCFAFVLLFEVTEIPVPFNVDEAGSAYDAISLVNHHTDRYLYRFPVYFVNFGGGQNALYTYLAAICIKIFGYSVLIVRLPAIIMSLLSALILTLTIRKVHGNTASIIILFFFCILPFSIMHSRWGLESYLLFPMLIFSCAVLYYAVETRKPMAFFISGVFLGCTLYAYTVAYILLPLFLCVICPYLLWIRKITWKNLLQLFLPLAVASLPLFLMLAVNNGLINEIRTRFFSVPAFPFYRAHEVSFQNIIRHLMFDENNVFYNLFVNDHCTYNIIPKFGSMYYITIPFILYGGFLCLIKSWKDIRRRTFSFDVMMSVLFVTAFGICLMFEGINANRACAVYFPLIYFLMLGTFETLKKSRNIALIFCIACISVFLFFIHYYFVDFPKVIERDSMFASVTDIQKALVFADEINTREETVYVLDSVQPYIYVLLSKQIDPYTFNEQKILSNDHFVKVLGKYRFRLDVVLPECIYILNPESQIQYDADFSGFNSKRFGSVAVFYQ